MLPVRMMSVFLPSLLRLYPGLWTLASNTQAIMVQLTAFCGGRCDGSHRFYRF